MVDHPYDPTKISSAYEQPASSTRVKRAVRALLQRGIEAELAADAEAAYARVVELVPSGSRVLCATSRTLEITGLLHELEESGRYRPVRREVMKLDRESQRPLIRAMRSSPEVVVGSVHAVTEEGEVLIASQSGSQLAPYVYGAGLVVWVVGTQKLVPDLQAGLRRILEYALPLEDARARQAYGTATGVNKLLIINRETVPGRIRLVFVSERLGF